MTIQLERFESVNLYTILETQKVVELDSPAPGAGHEVATKKRTYSFFSSEESAQSFIKGLRDTYQSKNPSLELISRSQGQNWFLEGRTNHKYSHAFEIHHSIIKKTIPSKELPPNIEELVKSPQIDVQENSRANPSFYQGIPVPDFSKLSLL